MIWDTNIKEKFTHKISDVYDKNGSYLPEKGFYAYTDSQYINDWIKPFRASKDDKSVIGKFPFKGNDFQNQNMIAIVNPEAEYNVEAGQFLINSNNLIEVSIYFSVRKCIEATWLNDRDQFLYPNDGWKTDLEFQNDCLAYTLFSNNIQSKYGINQWIPFTEYEVNARDKFESNFMTDFIEGKIKITQAFDLFNSPPLEVQRLHYSPPLEGCPKGGVVNLADENHPLPPPKEGNLSRNTQNYMSLPYNPKLKERAHELRKAGNLSEILFWQQVRNKQFKNLDFDRQKIIGDYIVDFYCANCNVVIEIDGSSHDNKQEYDAARDSFLQSLGLVVIHISDIDVKKNLSDIMQMLYDHPALIDDIEDKNHPLLEQQSDGMVDSPPLEGCPKGGVVDLADENHPLPPHQTAVAAPKENLPLQFSTEATEVFLSGKELWKYYHQQSNCNVNASLYDIREHFQGRNEKGKMNNKSENETYMNLITNLRDNLKILAKKIEPKVYEYEFLKG
jgi:very-short-patch-repair endonuclease